MLEIKDFASGSAGNCYLVKNNETKILLECGVNKSCLLKYLNSIGENIATLDCCLITHIHSDHSLLVDYVSDYIPTYSTYELNNKNNNIIIAKHSIPFKVGTIKVLPIFVEHGDCYNNAYIFLDKESTLFFGTDFSLMEQNISNFKLDKCCIECNYDDDLLKDSLDLNDKQHGKYLRQISTHMSKENCKEHLRKMDLSNCKEILLLHPSKFLINKSKIIKEFEQEFKIKTIFAKEK